MVTPLDVRCQLRRADAMGAMRRRESSARRRGVRPSRHRVARLATIGVWCAIAAMAPDRRVRAQIVPDATLPQPSTAIASDRGVEIGGGTASGGNLFHSFARFDLSDGQRATFATPPQIERILARVTGGAISHIDGTLAAGADLIFLAPDGIEFGDRARLDLGGSFLVTTASAIAFDDGLIWPSAAIETPLLSIAVPIGLTFDGARDPATISASGRGRPAAIDSSDPLNGVSAAAIASGTIVEFADSVLAVAPGHTLAAIGGNLDIHRTQLYAPSGQIVLGGVRSGRVGFGDLAAGGAFRFDAAELGGTIRLADRAALLSDGDPSGAIDLAAATIAIGGGSFVNINNFGDAPSGDITAIATDRLTIDGVSATGASSFVDAKTFGSGAGGRITVSADRLEMTDGANLNTASYGAGRSGDIDLQIGDVLFLSGFKPTLRAGDITNIGSSARATGDGGRVSIASRRIELQQGASILGLTTGDNLGGDLDLTASESIRLVGTADGTQGSSIGTVTLGVGDAGDVEVRAPRLMLSDGARLGSSTAAVGRAGNANLESSIEIVLAGRDAALGGSQILALSESIVTSGLLPRDLAVALPALAAVVPSGDSGDVSIATPRLFLTDGGSIQLANRGSGNPGRLNVNSDFVRLEAGSQVLAETIAGFGGGLLFDVRVLEVDNSAISTATAGSGRGGDIRIQARDRLEVSATSLQDTERFTLAFLETDAVARDNFALGIVAGSTGSGAGGAIEIEAGSFVLRNGGLLSPAVVGSGDAGSTLVRVAGDTVIDASILSTATAGRVPDAGRGGDIHLETENLRILNGGTIGTATFGPGLAGALSVDVRDRLQISGQSVASRTFGGNLTSGAMTAGVAATTGDGGDLSVRARQVLLDDGGTISASSSGASNAGSITIFADRLDLNGRASISASSRSGQGGNVSLVADRRAVLRDRGQIVTQAGRADAGGNGGNLSIDTDLLVAIESSQIAANAFRGSGGNITISAQSLFLSDESRIDASSQLGIDGTVDVTTETISIEPSLDSLPSDLLAGMPLDRGCTTAGNDRLSIVGVGRSPDLDRRTPETQPTWHDDRDWRDLSVASTRAAADAEIATAAEIRREATDWQRDDADGVRLVASASADAGHWALPTCTGSEAGR